MDPVTAFLTKRPDQLGPFFKRHLERQHRVYSGLLALMEKREAMAPFLKDPFAMGDVLPQYSRIVKEPMWMRLVIEGAVKGEVAETTSRVHMMFQNCVAYMVASGRCTEKEDLVLLQQCRELYKIYLDASGERGPELMARIQREQAEDPKTLDDYLADTPFERASLAMFIYGSGPAEDRLRRLMAAILKDADGPSKSEALAAIRKRCTGALDLMDRERKIFRATLDPS